MNSSRGKFFYHPFFSVKLTVKILLISCFLYVVLTIFNQIDLTHVFPIQRVRVIGANHIDHQELEQIVSPMIKEGFFNIKVDYIRDRLLQMPWVNTIFVSRDWPDQVDIKIIEKEPIATWNDESLLSDAGELFSPKKTSYPASLPKFIGPMGTQIMMLNYFREMNRILSVLHAKILFLELTQYLSWKLKLDNGIILEVGHSDVWKRLNQFVQVYPKIIGSHEADVDYIDLRYANGVAVHWKQKPKSLTQN